MFIQQKGKMYSIEQLTSTDQLMLLIVSLLGIALAAKVLASVVQGPSTDANNFHQCLQLNKKIDNQTPCLI